jgi:phospho-N-acetylmuramoyl-pentapeptide-transferase
VALLVAIVTTPALMGWLRRRQIGQHIREDGPASHSVKAGTPTMGGIAIVVAVVLGYFMGHVGPSVRFSRTGYLVLLAVGCFGIIGFLDDWIKVRHRRSLGLGKWSKLAAQIVVAVVFAELAVYWAHTSTTLSFTQSTSPGYHLGTVGWVIFAVVVMVGTSNAVNLTDGLDGLAAGSATFCFAVLAIIGYWIFRHYSIYHLLPASAIDMALSAVALAGACLGFLWWNAAPARIIMGDTGSLSIGAGLAALCLLLNVDLLLPIIGGLFVLETLSVIIQIISFRCFGTRVFRMAPFHHHFELLGWPETTVIVRFWVLAGLFAALGLGIFYGVFLTLAKIP